MNNQWEIDKWLAREKHLQGRHDQRKHGERGGAGSETSGAVGVGPDGKPQKFVPDPNRPDAQGLTKADRDWARGTKVVDAQGKPLIVHHGTPANDRFAEFRKPEKAQKNMQLGFGIHFAEDKKFAEGYATGENTKKKPKPEKGAKKGEEQGPPRGNNYQVLLQAKNPLYADRLVRPTDPEWKLVEALKGPNNRGLIEQVKRWSDPAVYLQRMIDGAPLGKAESVIRSFGYDAISYKAQAIIPDAYGARLGGESPSWVVFDPAQIRIVGVT